MHPLCQQFNLNCLRVSLLLCALVLARVGHCLAGSRCAERSSNAGVAAARFLLACRLLIMVGLVCGACAALPSSCCDGALASACEACGAVDAPVGADTTLTGAAARLNARRRRLRALLLRLLTLCWHRWVVWMQLRAQWLRLLVLWVRSLVRSSRSFRRCVASGVWRHLVPLVGVQRVRVAGAGASVAASRVDVRGLPLSGDPGDARDGASFADRWRHKQWMCGRRHRKQCVRDRQAPIHRSASSSMCCCIETSTATAM